MSHKQVLVVRKDLKMRRGKEIAQGAHASMGAILGLLKTPLGLEDPRAKPWLEGRFKKVTVQVESEEELLRLQKHAQELGLIECLIKDSGLTEFHGVPTNTVLAIGPDTEANVDAVCGDLKLY